MHFDLERELPNLPSENIEVNRGISAVSVFLEFQEIAKSGPNADIYGNINCTLQMR